MGLMMIIACVSRNQVALCEANKGHTAAITLITMCQRFIWGWGWVCVILYCAVWKTHARPFNGLISHKSPTRLPEATSHWDTVMVILNRLFYCIWIWTIPDFETYSMRYGWKDCLRLIHCLVFKHFLLSVCQGGSIIAAFLYSYGILPQRSMMSAPNH